jgi:hypothetical protein
MMKTRSAPLFRAWTAIPAPDSEPFVATETRASGFHERSFVRSWPTKTPYAAKSAFSSVSTSTFTPSRSSPWTRSEIADTAVAIGRVAEEGRVLGQAEGRDGQVDPHARGVGVAHDRGRGRAGDPAVAGP